MINHYIGICISLVGDYLLTECSCKAGEFSGILSDGCIQYKGIRYAVSERYCPPSPYVYPEGTHRCDTPAPYCPQSKSRIEETLLGMDYSKLPWDENCQYLSVTIPEGTDRDSKLPVMVWYHGGSYKNGGCENYIYNRSRLAREQDVIVIGVNYRLGVFGFVKDIDGNPANLGLLDSIEGLRWVKDNISAFGGDPDNITIFGQSAGADIVRCMIVSDGTDGLFKRAIIQSDPLGAMVGREEMEKKVLEEFNRLPNDAPIDAIIGAERSIMKHVTEEGYAKELVFAPHYGVYPLPKAEDMDKVLKERAPRHEILIGANTREVTAYVAGVKKVRRLYMIPFLRKYIMKIVNTITDGIFRRPSKEFAEHYAASGGVTHHYDFKWQEDVLPGACHGSELLLVFGGDGFDESSKLLMGRSLKEINETGEPIRKIWADFARNGSVQTSKIDGIIDIKRL